MKRNLLAVLLLLLAFVVNGCYYDKQNELYPTGVCDTSSVKFSTTILPILQTQCALAGCHANPSPQVGVLLSDYAGARVIALDGTLLGTINHEAGHNAMPQNADKLPECDISKIRIWVAAGAPNN